ncbi:MAG TPA: EVE domain-containing protein [Thermoplasmata archaeon]|nr:EVE domain-containing protein [Thermoplasmata archaeon]
MPYWLVKEEPSHYAYRDLARDGATDWSGVHNALAQRYLKAMRPGDPVYYYHSGPERAVVGIARVASAPRPDPGDARGAWTVRLAAVRPLPAPVPLSAIRADPAFAAFDLVRISRLSVMPVPPALWARIGSMARPATGAPTGRARATAPPARARGARRRR